MGFPIMIIIRLDRIFMDFPISSSTNKGCSPGLLQLPLPFKAPHQGPIGTAVPQQPLRRCKDGGHGGRQTRWGSDHGEALLGQLIDEGLEIWIQLAGEISG